MQFVFLRNYISACQKPLRLVLLCFAVLPGIVYGQHQLSLDPTQRISQYVHDSWQTDDGLPQNTVSSIAQSNNGYLWIGTDEGLVRFDGLRFETFDKRNASAFRVNHIVQLVTDRTDRLWIGTRGGGLIIYENGRFAAVDTSNGLSSNFITALYEDSNGQVWVGTYGGGVLSIDDGKITSYGPDNGLFGDIVSSIDEDPEGTLRIGTNSGLYELRENGFQSDTTKALAGAFVTMIYSDYEETTWVGTENRGLFALVRDTLYLRLNARESNGYVSSALIDSEQSIWFGTSRGELARYRDGGFEWQDPLMYKKAGLHALFEDREGSLWIGTAGDGIHRMRSAPFTSFGATEGLRNDLVYSITERAEGGMWIGTGAGLDLIRNNTSIPYPHEDVLDGKEILSTYEQKDGTLWIGTHGQGLFRIREAVIDSFKTSENLPSDRVFALNEDIKGNMWIGTDAGIVLYDGREFTVIDGIPSPFITAIEAGQNGDVWIGTYDAGMVRFSGGRLKQFSTADGLSSNAVLSLHEDEDGILWVGTYGGGLNRLEIDQITPITTREGLFNDNVYVVLEDRQNRLWMTCNKGIFRVEKNELNQLAAGQRSQIVSHSYVKEDGIRNPEATGGQQPAGWVSSDGQLWFPTIEGFVVVNPSTPYTNPHVPKLVIERFEADDQLHSPRSTNLSIPPGSQKLVFSFTAPSLVIPDRVNFRYMLKGFDSEWSRPETRREAIYTNLPPGDYTFHVIASNNDGKWNEKGASLAFTLKPFFYETTVFKVMMVLLGVLICLFAYRFRILRLKARQTELERIVDARTKDLRAEKDKTEKAKQLIEAQANKLRELDRFKTRFFANISHEFRTPLTMIIGPLENVLGGSFGELDEKLFRQVRIMLRNAQRLLRLINQLLDLSKLEAGKMKLRTQRRDIVQFLESVLLSCTPLAENKSITLEFDCNELQIDLHYEPDKLENVFYNLLSNALKFTPNNGTISLSVAKQNANDTFPQGFVEILVSDTGPGIPPDQLNHIFDRFYQVDSSNTRAHEGTGIGLALVHELVLLHYGAISVESASGAGTQFTIQFPLGATHLGPNQILENITDNELLPIINTGVVTELANESMSFDHENEEDYKEANAPVAEDPLHESLVLIVDDNADVREYVSGILNEHFNVEIAKNGVEGLEKAKSLRPDLIISDVMMPLMDGNELCKLIKENLELNHIPVILMTARATNELRIEGLEMGADDYIAKPFNARELLVRSRNLMLMRQQEKDLKLLNEELEEKVAEQLGQILNERLKYEEELLEAKDKAESSARLKSTILDNINHEFRTPIAGILGSAEVLEMESKSEAQEFIGYIKESTLRLQNTLDAVVELSSLENQDVILKKEIVNFKDLVKDASDRFKPLAEQQGLSWSTETPLDPVYINAEENAVLRIIDHLIDNAIKFTPKGGITMRLSTKSGRASLTVSDTGIGISDSFMPSLFEAFLQESNGIARSYEGVGIGLTISKRLTELIGGKLTVKSQKDEGSEFTLSFPLVRKKSKVELAAE